VTGSGEPRLAPHLERARELGCLGPGPIGPQLAHAQGFVAAAVEAAGRPPEHVLDLGSGGGLPGLVVAAAWPETPIVLVDAMHRRCELLRRAVAELGWSGRVRVAEGRGEVLAHDPELRERFDLVTARSFGRPAVTAEIGSGFLQVGGWLVVSEPPEGADRSHRWPTTGLELLGFGPATIGVHGGATFAAAPKRTTLADRFPRRTGLPGKRPLWCLRVPRGTCSSGSGSSRTPENLGGPSLPRPSRARYHAGAYVPRGTRASELVTRLGASREADHGIGTGRSPRPAPVVRAGRG
jgi:hypothetical protein